ncbi:MAG: hypothetical protein AAGA56_27970 [Myxococcota bacterium]
MLRTTILRAATFLLAGFATACTTDSGPDTFDFAPIEGDMPDGFDPGEIPESAGAPTRPANDVGNEDPSDDPEDPDEEEDPGEGSGEEGSGQEGGGNNGGGNNGGGNNGGGNNGGGNGGPGCSYAPLTSCAGPSDANSNAPWPSDDGAAGASFYGDTEEHIEVHFAETLTGIFDDDHSFSASLQSPQGMDWDLIVYEIDPSAPVCDSNTRVGSSDAIDIEWDDTFGDDATTFVFYVQHNSGTACGSAASWVLNVEANTAE